jgi:hypothetical protein
MQPLILPQARYRRFAHHLLPTPVSAEDHADVSSGIGQIKSTAVSAEDQRHILDGDGSPVE